MDFHRVILRGAREGVTRRPNLNSTFFSRTSLTSATALLIYVAFADFVIHMLFAGNYGYFRDELYYIVSGTQHLSLGYVDFPPFIAYVAALLHPISGDSLISIHFVAALNGALLIIVVGMMARELGGGRRAQLLAAVSTAAALAFLAFGSLFTPDSFDSLWWSLLAYLTIRISRRDEPRLWAPVGLVLGVGMLTKLTILFFAGALLVSFLVIPSARRKLRSEWFALGALISVVFILPMTYWNSINGWPMVRFYAEFTGDFSGGGPANFLYSQAAIMSYLTLPITIAGLYFYLRSQEGSQLRALGLASLILLVFTTVLDMKVYYPAPIYPMLFAGGAVLIERGSSSKNGVSRWFGSRPFVACLVIVGALLAPVAMPVLSPSTFISKYSVNDYQNSPNADRYGWSIYVSNLSQAYDTLPTSVKSQACVLTSNYGEASAVNFLGRGSGLPEAISGHNNYYIWGPGSCTGQVLITVGYSLSDDQSSFRNVTLLTTFTCQYCVTYEQSLPVYVCTDPTFSSIAQAWSLVRHYD